MAITQDFKESVRDNKLIPVRIMLKDSLKFDPTGVDFDEKLKYAEANMQGLIDEHDGKAFKQNYEDWTKDYLAEENVNLIDNFSRERIELVKKMSAYIYRDKAAEIIRRRAAEKEQRQKAVNSTSRYQENNHSSNENKDEDSSIALIIAFFTAIGLGVAWVINKVLK